MEGAFDTSTWPMWAKLLATTGPLGILAGLMAYLWVAETRAHHKTRDTKDAELKSVRDAKDAEIKLERDARAAETRAILENAMKASTEQGKAYADKYEELSANYHDQLLELTSRVLTMNSEVIEDNRKITREVGSQIDRLAETVKTKQRLRQKG